MPFAHRVCGVLALLVVALPIHGPKAAPPDKGDTRSSAGSTIQVPHNVVYTVSCRIEGAQGNNPGANLYLRNESAVALPTGTKIQWAATPQPDTGIYVLATPLLSGESRMVGKHYDSKCTAKIVP